MGRTRSTVQRQSCRRLRPRRVLSMAGVAFAIVAAQSVVWPILLPQFSSTASATVSDLTSVWSGSGPWTSTSPGGIGVTATSVSVPGGGSFSFNGTQTLQSPFNGLPDPFPYSSDYVPDHDSFAFTVRWPSIGPTGTLLFEFTDPVVNPILHLDRLGGSTSNDGTVTSNGAIFEVTTPGATLTKLSGVDHLTVGTTTFQREVETISGASTSSCAADWTLGTACGSIQVNGTFTELEFEWAGSGNSSSAADGIEFAWELFGIPEVNFGKSSDATTLLEDGDLITYTIDVESVSTAAVTNIEIGDVLSPGLVYEPESTVLVYETDVITETALFTDTFESGIGLWNTDDNGDSSDVNVQNNQGSQRLHLQDNNVGAWRPVPDLTSYDEADLTFDFRRVGWEGNEEIGIYIRADVTGVSTTNANCDTDGDWVQLSSITRLQSTDPGYQSATYVIPAEFRTANAGICLFTNGSMNAADDFYADNITVIGRNIDPTTATLDNDPASPAAALVDGTTDPGLLISPADAISLTGGKNLTVTYQARLDTSLLPFGATTVTNGATFNSTNYPLPLPSTTVSDDLATVDLSLVKSDDGPVVAGEEITYTITVINAGPEDATGVVVNDTPDANVTVTSVTSSQGDCSAFPCTLGALADDASATITVVGTVGLGAPTDGTLETDANEPGVDDCDGADLCNVASVSSDSLDWEAANDSDDEPTNVIIPVIELAKSATAPVDNGDGTYDVTFTVTVSNSGSATGSYDLDDALTTATGVTATVLTGPTYDTGTSTDSTIETPGALPSLVTDGTVDPGAQDVFTYAVQFATTPAALADLDPCPTADGNYAAENTATTSTGASASACVDIPALAVDKPAPANDDADGSGDVSAGDTLTYTITATNIGTSSLSGVVVTDDLTGDSTTCAGPLATDDTCVLVATYVVQPGDLGSSIVNIATAESDQTDEVSDGETVGVSAPSLAVDKPAPANDDADGSGDVSVGDTLTYTITATNTGAANLTNVVVADDLTGDSTTCAGPLVPDATCVLTATYVVQPGDVGGDIVNTATADSDQTDEVSDGETVSVPLPSLVVDKPAPANDDADGSGDVSLGDTLTYTITATNAGTASLTDLVVDDDLTGDSTTCGVVLPGGTCVLVATYVVQPGDLGGDIVNTATADSDQTDEVSEGETVSVSSPVLAVDKPAPTNDDADGSGDVSAGDTLTYTITATNTGTANLTNVTVVDDLTGDSTACAGPLAPDATCVLVATYVVQPGDVGGDIVNTATADSDQTAPVTEGETVAAPAALLAVDKPAPSNDDADGSGDVSAGDTLTYTITATNTGAANLTNVSVVDDLTGDSTACAGPLAPDATCVLVATYVVQQGDLGGDIVNTATADSDQTAEVSEGETVSVPSPVLVVDKPAPSNDDADGSGDVSAGDTLTYTITATNTGAANLTNVTVVDDLTGDSTSCAGPVGPDGTCVLTATYVVQPGDLGGDIVNTATADSDQTGEVTEGETVAVPAPVLAVDKPAPSNDDADGSGDVSAGDTLTYTITATNTGAANLTNVSVVDDLTGDSTACAGPLATGGTCVLTATYVVLPGDLGGDIVNVATADSDQTAEVAEGETVAVPSPVLAVDKPAPSNDDADGSGDVSAGDTLTYTITATNTGTASLTDVVVDDDLTGDSTTCGVVLPGGTCVLTATYVVQPGDLGGDIVNTATADSDQTGEVSEGETVAVPSPVLAVDKPAPSNDDADGSGDVSVGDTLTYTITATNTGTANLTNVTIIDDLTSDSTTCAGPLAPVATCVLVATYVVQPGDLGGDIVNTATADSDQADEVSEGETVSVPPPGLAVDKPAPTNDDADGSGDVSAGDTLTYTITATNTGTASLTNVVVTDDLTGDSITCAGPLASDGTCVLTATYVVQPGDLGGDIVNTATADSDQTAEVSEGETVTVPSPTLAVDKPAPSNDDADGSGDVSVGDTLTYTITATNTGTANLTNVTVVDDLTGDSTSCAGPVVPDGTCVLTATYVVLPGDLGGDIVNVATADSDQADEVSEGETVSVPSPVLAVDKPAPSNDDSDGSGDVSAGDTLTYTITATNTGTASLTNVVVTDDLTGDSITCAGPLAAGGTCVLTATYVVLPGDLGGDIVNVATADSDQTGEVAEGETVAVPSPVLAVDKPAPSNDDADGSGDVSAGDTLTYTITATNTGTANLTNVTIIDALTGDSTSCAGPIAPDGMCVLTATYVVQPGDVGGDIVNVATADSDQTGEVSEGETVAVPSPNLAVDKPAPTNDDADGSGDVSAGDTLTYTITATNAGTATLTDVVVTDDLTGDTITCGAVLPGGTCVLVATYVVLPGDLGGDIVNTATADSDQTAEVSEGETVSVPSPVLAVDKPAPVNDDADGSGDVSAGDTLTYTITATNTGTANLTNVTVVDDLTGDSTSCAGPLATDGTCVLTATYVVLPADLGGDIVNTATADSDQTAEVSEGETVSVPSPVLAVDKPAPVNDDADGSGDVSAGDTLTYTITATNTGTANLTNVTVVDDLTGDSTSCAGPLATDGTCVLTATYVVLPGDLGTDIVNVATADSDQTAEVTEGETVAVPLPVLAVDKPAPTNDDADGSGDVSLGDTLTYTITATNTGAANLTNVTVVDDLTGDSTSCAGPLATDATCVLTATYVVQPGDLGSSIVNIATADSDQTGEVSEGETVAVPLPSLAVDKPAPANDDADGSGDVSVGDTLTYTITATNAGAASLTNVVVADDLTGDSTTCGVVLPGASCVLTATVVIEPGDLGSDIVNTATANSDQTAEVSEGETVTVPSPSLAVDKPAPSNDDADGSGDVSAGDTLTYTITATNTGTANLTNVTVVDDLTGDSTSCAGPVVPDGTCVLTATYVVLPGDLGGDIVNTATADSDQTGEVTEGETVAVPSPVLAVDKPAPTNDDADGSGDVSAGDTLTYTITATNTGMANLTNVSVVDDLTGDSTSCAGPLAPDATCVLTATYVVQPGDLGGDIVNIATANGDQTGEVTEGETVAVPAPALAVDKPAPANDDADGSGDVSVGDTLTYTITATNTGTANLTNVTVVDDLTGDSTSCAGPIVPDGTCVLTATYVVQPGDLGGDIVNVATADSDQTGEVTEGETVTVPSPSLAVDKPAPTNNDADGSEDVSLGDTLTYTITATNTGTANLTDVTVTDDLTGDTITCPGPLATDETCVLTATFVVLQPEVDAGRIDNEATAVSDQTGPVIDTETVLIPRVAELQVSKTDAVPTDIDDNGVDAGDTIAYTITVTNTGNVTVRAVDVSDSLFPTVSGGPVDLIPGGSAVFTGTYMLDQDDLDAGFVVNQATASGLDPTDTPVVDLSDDPDDDTDADAEDDGEPDDPTVALLPQDPVLSLDKSGGPEFQAIGDLITYTYVLTNDGNVTLSSPFSIVDDKTVVDCTAATEIAPGESTTCTATYTVVPPDIEAEQVVNVATATAAQPSGAPVTSDEATATVPADLRADLEIQKVVTGGSTSHVPGVELSYTLTVINNGPSVTTTTTVVDSLPDGTVYVSAIPSNDGECDETGGEITCDLGVLAIDETVTIEVVVDVDPSSTSALTNNVTVASNLPDDVAGNNLSAVSTSAAPSADIEIDKIAPATYVPGLPITYQLVVSNAGPSTATGVRATDTLPADVVFDAGATDAECENVAGTVTCGEVDLLPGESATFEVVVNTPSSATTTFTNSAIANSDVPDPDVDNNTDTEDSDPAPLANLVLDKSAPATPVAAGEQFDFTITVLNEGPSDAVAVNVVDALPAGLTYVSSNVAGGAGTEACTNAVLCDLGTIVAGTTETITIRVAVASDVVGEVVNTATATTSTPGDVVDDSTDDHAVDIVEVTDVGISKSDDVDPVAAGGVVTYTIEVVNSGPSQATDVVISDPIPAGMTFVSAPGCDEAAGVVTCDIAVLPVGVPASFDVTVRVDSDVPDAATLTNTATVTTASDTNATNDEASEDTAVVATADLVLNKISTPNPFVPGQLMTYTISVVNLGPSDAQSVVITDALPADFTPISASPAPACEITGNDLTCTMAVLAAGDDLVVTVTGLAASGATSFVNTASVASSTTDPVPTNNSDDDGNDGDPLADLSVTKADSVAPVAAGAALNYTITVTNNGPSDAVDVSVTDTVPAGYTVTSVDRAECDTSVSCTFAVVAAGTSETIVVRGTVGSNVTDTGGAPELSNTVTVSSSTPDPITANDTDTETTDVVEVANVLLTKIEPSEPIVPGGTREYTIQVANIGPSDADNIVVTDTLPPGLTYSSASGAPCVPAGAIVTCDVGTLIAKSPVLVITIVADVDPSVTGIITNAAEVSSTTPDPVPSDNTDTSDSEASPEADLSISKFDLADPISAGTSIEYSISGRNTGPSTAVGVTVVDTLPPGVTLVDAVFTTGSGTCDEDLGVISCDLGILLPGSIFAIDVEVEVDPSISDGSTLSNSVEISSETPDPFPDNNTDDEDTTILGVADVGVTKVTNFPEATPGENIEYTIVVNNYGPSDALAVSITDELPDGLLNVVATGATCTTGDPLTCDIGTMAPDTSVTITVTADIDPSTAGLLVNNVTLASDTDDPNADNDTASTEIPVAPEADLWLAKNGPATVVAGRTLTYTVIATNDGPSDADNVVIADTLPAGTSLITATIGVGTGTCDATTCTFPVVAAGTSASITYLVDVASSVAEGSSLVNTAEVTSDTLDPDTTNNADDHSTAVSAVADLSILKTVSIDPFVPGQPVTYTAVVQNSGPSDAVAVQMSDTMPTGLTVKSATATAGTCSTGAVVTCDLGTIVDGGSVTITIVADTDPSLTAQVSNTADVTTSTTDPESGNDSSTVTTDPAPTADLQIVKSTPITEIAAGLEMTYRVVLTNLGSSTAVDVELVDVLPGDLGYVDHVRTSTGGTCAFEAAGTTVRCTAAALLPGDAISVDITVLVSPSVPDGDEVVNTAVANAATDDPVPGNDTSRVATPVAAVSDLAVTKELTSAPLVPGTSEQYEIEVTNAGPSDALGVTVSDTVPAGLTITGVLPSTGDCSDDGATLGCTIDVVPVGGSVTITVTVDVDADVSADVVNTALTGSVTFDPNLDDNSSTATDPVVPTADLVVAKSTSTPVIVPGEPVTYVIVVTNAGPSDATNTVLDDVLPDGLTVATLAATQGTCAASGSSITCGLGTVPAGGSVNVTVVADVDPQQIAQLRNTATVSSDADDPDTSNNTSTAIDEVVPSADVSIVKSVTPVPFVPGQPVTYTMVVSNAGPSSARSIVVTDTLPSGSTPTAATANVGFCAITGNTVTCTLGVLDPLDEMTVTLVADTAPGSTGDIVNAAAVSSATTDPDDSNNSDSATTSARPTADVAITKTAPELATGGASLTYELTVTNAGPSVATDVLVTDDLPALTMFDSASSPCAEAGGAVTCGLGALDAGGSITIEIVVLLDEVTATETVTNTADVSTSAIDPNGANDASSVETLVSANAGVLTGTVWIDSDRDGTIDSTEDGVAGVTIIITGDPDGDGTNDTFTVVTGPGGDYAIMLPPGEWTVTTDDATLPFGSAPTTATIVTVVIEPTGAADVSFGRRYGSISGSIWLDNDGDGVVDPDEPGISGVIVRARCPGPDGVIGTADDVLGFDVTKSPYEITGLPIGQTCEVTIDTSSLPPLVRQTFDPDGQLDGKTASAVVDGDNGGSGGLNFGYRSSGATPATGSDIRTLIQTSAMLFLAGAVLWLLAKRRRAHRLI